MLELLIVGGILAAAVGDGLYKASKQPFDPYNKRNFQEYTKEKVALQMKHSIPGVTGHMAGGYRKEYHEEHAELMRKFGFPGIQKKLKQKHFDEYLLESMKKDGLYGTQQYKDVEERLAKSLSVLYPVGWYDEKGNEYDRYGNLVGRM